MTVSIAGWLAESSRRIKNNGARGAVNALYDIYLGGFLSITSRYPYGTNLLSQDWDAIVILDACRVDALREVAPEYDFIEGVDEIQSVGSHSFEWMKKTFTEQYRDEIGNLSYITANPFIAQSYLEDDVPPDNRTIPFGPSEYGTVTHEDFGYIDEIRNFGVDDEFGFVLPETVTDRAIRAGREEDTDRLMVHYMQPHDPFIVEGDSEEHIYGRLRSGDLSKDEAWDWYLDTLRRALDEVEVLLENLDAERVVITADHGEAFGELGFYGHMPGFPHPVVKQVPWVETTATDTGSRDTVDESPANTTQSDIEEHLEALGYR